MPLKLLEPARAPNGKNFYVVGTYLGQRVRQSTGSDRRSVAQSELKRIEREIERGRFAEPVRQQHTFADACLIYLRRCPAAEVQYIERLLDHFTDTPLDDFTPAFIDEQITAIFGDAKASTINRCGISPLAAVLHAAADAELMPWLRIRRRKEAKVATQWCTLEQAEQLIAAAGRHDAAREIREAKKLKRGELSFERPRLAPLLVFLFGTGARISEATALTWRHVDLTSKTCTLEHTKNGETYVVPLGPAVFDAIANMPLHPMDAASPGKKGKRSPWRQVFGWPDRDSPRKALAAVKRDAGLPEFHFHMTRHSYATWLRIYQGADLRKLMDLGRWKDAKSTMRYQHVAGHEVRQAIEALPVPGINDKPVPGIAQQKRENG